MTHRAETIMQQVLTLVTGLATTEDRVERGRAYAVGSLQLPALMVFMGEDDAIAEEGPNLIRSLLIVKIDMVATDKADQIETTLNRMREEINVALGVDSNNRPKLDLEFVVEATELGTEEPQFTGEGEEVTGRQIVQWTVNYKRDRANPAN